MQLVYIQLISLQFVERKWLHLPCSTELKKCRRPTGNVCKPNEAAFEALEKAMGSETKEKFAVRYEEGYDLETDEFYVVWSKLKTLSIKDSEKVEIKKECRTAVKG